MKRTPLKRKTGIRRSTKPMKRTPLRRVSAVRTIANRVYSAKRKVFLAENPKCQACAVIFDEWPLPSTEVHHKAGRLGKNFLDTSTWLAVDRSCHSWIEDNKKAARELGLITYK